MDSLTKSILALLAAILLTGGSGALRALHVAAEHREGHAAALARAETAPAGADGCGDHDHHDAGEAPRGSDHAPGGDAHCDTCDLLVALVGMAGGSVPVPTFHALVAVEDAGAPRTPPAPAPLRTLAARPPPSC